MHDARLGHPVVLATQVRLAAWLDVDRDNRHAFVRRTMDEESGSGPWYISIKDASDGGSDAYAYGNTLDDAIESALGNWKEATVA